MTRNLTLSALLIATAACRAERAPNEETANGAAASSEPSLPLAPEQSRVNAVDPSTTAPELTPPEPHLDPDAPPLPSEKSALGAARRLLEYCDAVATKRYRDAYALWSDNGQATGMTLAQFSDSFDKYATYDCHIGEPGDTEGAAGSIYVTVPLRVTGALTRGGGFVLEGPVTMRRVNDVPGSTAEQRRWHISASGLKPRP